MAQDHADHERCGQDEPAVPLRPDPPGHEAFVDGEDDTGDRPAQQQDRLTQRGRGVRHPFARFASRDLRQRRPRNDAEHDRLVRQDRHQLSRDRITDHGLRSEQFADHDEISTGEQYLRDLIRAEPDASAQLPPASRHATRGSRSGNSVGNLVRSRQ